MASSTGPKCDFRTRLCTCIMSPDTKEENANIPSQHDIPLPLRLVRLPPAPLQPSYRPFTRDALPFPSSPQQQPRRPFSSNKTRLYSLRSKCILVYKATRQHARNLGFFALVYKSTMLFLRHTSPTGKERHYDSFLAGLLGGYTVFGRTIHNSVSQQIVIYVAARVCLALAKLAVQQRHVGGGGRHGGASGGGGGWELFGNGEMRRAMVRNGWPAFASLSWAMVMYIFRWHPESVQSSLRSSMSYMWVFPFFRATCWNWNLFANLVAVMYSRIIGIRCGRYFGIISRVGRSRWGRVRT
jgi:hypothetical protein